MKKLKGRVAMITGAGSGIGRATALLFASEGARLALVGRRREVLEGVVKEVRMRGGEALVAAGDIAIEEEASRIVYESVGRFGPIHILVNNAGIYAQGTVLTTGIDDWDDMMNVNLRGVFALTKRIVPEMESAGGGSIINVSSTVGDRPVANALAYATSKAALNMFTQCCAVDLAPSRIRVNAVSPAIVDTPIHPAEDRESWAREMGALHPLGRVGKPEEIARAILYLAGEDAEWITGTNLVIDGGISLT